MPTPPVPRMSPTVRTNASSLKIGPLSDCTLPRSETTPFRSPTAGAIAVMIPVTAVVTVGTTVAITPVGPKSVALMGVVRAPSRVPTGTTTGSPATLSEIVAVAVPATTLPRVWFGTETCRPVPMSTTGVVQVGAVPTTQTATPMFSTAALSVFVSAVCTRFGTVFSTFPTRVIRLFSTAADSTSSPTFRLFRPRPVVSENSAAMSAVTSPVRRFTLTTPSPTGVSRIVFMAAAMSVVIVMFTPSLPTMGASAALRPASAWASSPLGPARLATAASTVAVTPPGPVSVFVSVAIAGKDSATSPPATL